MNLDTVIIMSKQYAHSELNVWVHSDRQQECWVHEGKDGEINIHECETSLKWLLHVAGNEIQGFGSYRAVNDIRLDYWNQFVNAVYVNNRNLLGDPYKTHKYSLNLVEHKVTSGL